MSTVKKYDSVKQHDIYLADMKKHDTYLEDTLSISSHSGVQRSATSAVLQVGITTSIQQHLGCISTCVPGR